jgi:transposase
MNCPKCKCSERTKDGIIRTLQRYKCKQCNYRYTVEKKSDLKSDETKRLALEMYLEGLGFRSIGRILKISYGTVFKWIKDWGDKVSLPKSTEPIEIVELDEMHTYIMSKKTTVGYGLLLIDLEKGMSILCVETGQQKHLRNSGTKLNI